DRGEVTGRLVGHDVDLDTAGQLDRLRVRRPVRRHDQDLVTRVEQRGERLVDRLLAAVGHQHLGGVDLEPAVAQRLVGDRLPQLGQAGGGRVLVESGVAARLYRGLDDVVGRGEVGLAGAEADDRTTGGLHRLGLAV